MKLLITEIDKCRNCDWRKESCSDAYTITDYDCTHPKAGMSVWDVGYNEIHPDCPLPDQVEPDRDQIFREELERRWPEQDKFNKIFMQDLPNEFNYWLKSELLKPTERRSHEQNK